MTEWKTGYRGYAFDVWWVDLVIPVGVDDEGAYSFRIRDRKFSSRKITVTDSEAAEPEHSSQEHKDAPVNKDTVRKESPEAASL